MRKSLLLASLVWFFILSLSAVENYNIVEVNPLFEPWRWKSFSEISDKSIRCLAEGKDQSMWYGTAKGIYHYDGLRWVHYKDENEVISVPVYGLCYTRAGILYAVSPKGICHFDGQKWTTDLLFPEKNVLGSEWEILNIKETPGGEIWIGVYFGLVQIKNNAIKLYTTKAQLKGIESYFKNIGVEDVTGVYSGIEQFIVYDVLEDNSGNLWLGLEDGQTIRLYDNNHDIKSPQNYRLYNTAYGMNISRLPILYQSTDGSIYNISQSIGGAVNKFNPSTETWSNHALSVDFGGDNLNFSICETADGTLWIGGLSRIFAYKNGQWSEYKQPLLQVPPTRIILKTTSDGSIWIGGHLGDVIRIEYQTQLWKTFKGLSYQCQTSDSFEWFISTDGNVVRSNSDFTFFEKLGADFPMSDPVRIYVDKKNTMWAIGSHNGSASIAFNITGSWSLKLFPDLCWGFHQNGIFETRDYSIWFGANADCGNTKWGVYRFTPSLGNPDSDAAWRLYPGNEICEVAYALAETESNSLLCGNFKGLFEFDGQTTRELHKVLMEDIIKVESMVQDPVKGVWIGTRSQGVIYYINDKEWTQYNTENGLASNSVSSLMVSNDSAIWVATDKGISRFDGHNWITYALPDNFRIGRGNGSLVQGIDGSIWVNYASMEWYRRAYYKKSFTTENSPVISYRIKPENSAPETEIVRFEKKVYYPGNTIIFWKGVDRWNETNENEIQFSYKLDDDEWSEFTTEKSHSFLTMRRGWHTLQVRARDNFLNIDTTPQTIEFKVIPPIWGQIWFILLMTLLLLAIIFLFLASVRKNRMMEEQNLTMKKKNEDLVKQQAEIEVKGKQIMDLLEKERDNHWFNEGIIKVNEIIKTSKEDLEGMTHALLVNIIGYLELNSAGILLHRKNVLDESDEGYLELISAYGYNSERLAKKQMRPQEGLAGACLKEKKTMIFENVPDSYYISSGLGKAKMTCLALIPVKLHDEIIGVLELSSFSLINKKKIKLLEVIAENIASNILTLDSKRKIESMYKSSQEQSAKLLEQEEEMRQQMEELQATQEESIRREKELTAQIEEYRKEIEKIQKELNKQKKQGK